MQNVLTVVWVAFIMVTLGILFYENHQLSVTVANFEAYIRLREQRINAHDRAIEDSQSIIISGQNRIEGLIRNLKPGSCH